jgi:hypothetical protein
LRHHGREWVFNSADIVSPQNSQAAFVAFFGDIEHEVSEVKSGYRVTLTYNLYFGDDKSTIVSPTLLPVDDTEAKVKKSLIALLNNPNFLPGGGLLGFGLSHLYPINPHTYLDKLGESLKGTDAAIKRACDSLSLEFSVKTVYNSEYTEGVACLLDHFAELGEFEIEDDIVMHLQGEFSGLLVFDMDKITLRDAKSSGFTDVRPILWVRPLTERNKIEASYVSYGNEATLAFVYGEICLVLKVDAFKDRETYDL